MGKVVDAIHLLRVREANFVGQDLVDLLQDLGFEVRQSSSGNHQVVTHDGLDGFTSTNFDKGHKKQMLAVYPRAIRKVLERYKSQLEELLGERDGKA